MARWSVVSNAVHLDKGRHGDSSASFPVESYLWPGGQWSVMQSASIKVDTEIPPRLSQWSNTCGQVVSGQ